MHSRLSVRDTYDGWRPVREASSRVWVADELDLVVFKDSYTVVLLSFITQVDVPPPMAIVAYSDDVVPTEEFTAFAYAAREKAQREWKREDAARLDAPLALLLELVHTKYQGSLNAMVQRANQAGENAKLSAAVADAFTKRGRLSRATLTKHASLLKRVLAMLDFPAGFLDSLRLLPALKKQHDKTLGRYGSLPATHPARVRLDGWSEIIRNGTRNQSDLSVRNVMSFYINSCLPALGLDLNKWPEDITAHVKAHLDANPDALHQAIGDKGNGAIKTGRLRFFLKDILGLDITVETPKKKRQRQTDDDEGDGHDVHRISSADLELLYAEASKEPLNELLFLLMLTTGLRIGGVAKILTRNVADVKGGQYVVREQGKTKEKGNKFAFFVVCPRVKHLLHAWLSIYRPADEGPFLFPGTEKGSHFTTDCIRNRFKQMCQKCGLEGREFHPHALRHTNAHILLECGNSVESVSKCLNHSSTSTTQKFYLTESAAEVQSRCNIPWARMESESEKRKRALDSLPGFLKDGAQGGGGSSSSRTQDPEAKKRRRAEKAAILESFRPQVP